MVTRSAVWAVLAVAFVLPASAQAGWAQPSVISPHGWQGAVAMNSAGMALTAYAEADPSGWGTVGVATSVRKPGGRWGAPEEIYSGDANATSVAVGGDGSLYVVFVTAGGDTYLASADPGQAFGAPALLSHNVPPLAGGAVAADDAGRATIVFLATGGSDVMAVSRQRGQPFGPAQMLAPSATGVPAIAMDRATGETWVSWSDTGHQLAFARRPAGGDFTAAAHVPGDDPAEASDNYGVYAAANGDALISWVGVSAPNGAAVQRQIRAALFREGTSEPFTFAARSSSWDWAPYAALGDDGTAVLAWGFYDEPLTAVVARPGTGFGDRQTLAPPAGPGNGSAAVDSRGNVVVLWNDSAAETVTAGVLPAGASSFCPPVDVGAGGTASRLSTATDGQGNAVSVYQRYKSSSVTALDYSAGDGCPPVPQPVAGPTDRTPATGTPAVGAAPRIRIGTRVALSRGAHSAVVSLACLSGAACSGKLALTWGLGRARSSARGVFSVAAGTRAKVRLALGHRAAHNLLRHKQTRGTLVVSPQGGAALSTKVALIRL